MCRPLSLKTPQAQRKSTKLSSARTKCDELHIATRFIKQLSKDQVDIPELLRQMKDEYKAIGVVFQQPEAGTGTTIDLVKWLQDDELFREA